LAVRISFGDPAAPHSCFAIGSVYSVEYVFPVNSMKCPDLFFAPEAKSGQFEGG
jgi:hypothetical protein